jgi:flagellar hook-length control protein FliK
VRADSPAAAQTLAQASGDLRQALTQQGFAVLDLDIRDRGTQDQVPQEPSRQRPNGGTPGEADDADEVTVDPLRVAAAGTQIDVLA